MPVERFGEFELDTDAAQLRLAGREVALQPRVFDLLAFLVRNRERVVGKDELLAAVWPGVFVTDASLQRAVSLARGALREGGLEGAIRTHARRGYRFCLDGLAPADPPADGPLPEAGPQRARRLVEARRWDDAVEAFEAADESGTLDATDLERWALAAECSGSLLGAVAPLERAAAAYSASGDPEAAARVTVALARVQLELREMAVTEGCLRRAARLLADRPLCSQHGHLAWMRSRFALYEGDIAAGLEQAQRAIDIGRQLGDADLECVGMLFQGIALQARGDVRAGIELQNEAAAAVVSGHVSPVIGGLVYCGLIAGCCNVGDWPRAGQWTERFTRWSERSRLKAFTGSCLLYRAQVFVARGQFGRAHAELANGTPTLRSSAPWAVGDAYRLLGDVYLARGEFEQAETAYRSAYEHGCDPYPGYAMLLHYRGQSEAAVRGLEQAAEPTHWVAGQRRGQHLACAAAIAAQSGSLERAAAILARLDAQPELWSTGAAKAQVTRARAEVELAAGDARAAAALFREAVHALHEMQAPVEAAVVRLRLAACLAGAADGAGAELELLAAGRAFQDAGAAFYLEQCAALRREVAAGAETGPGRPHGEPTGPGAGRRSAGRAAPRR